jgi:uncharacterized repeat protein (TIGR03803 family)
MTTFEKWAWVCLLCAMTATAAPAQTFKTLASFDIIGYPQYTSLVQGVDGDLYGTTQADWGMVFKITTAGDLTVLCYFGEDTCYQESYPLAGLTQATDGNFYGTTWQGGVNPSEGEGTVFKTTAGENDVTLLYSFCSQANCADGDDPFAPLMQAKNGNFYGTTFDGGTKGYGTVFEITSQGKLTTLHSFGYEDGAGPVAGLVQAKNGNFYGTSLYGGAHGAGVVFEISSGGTLTMLYSFCSQKGCADGTGPYAGLVQAKDGNFYGTAHGGGAYNHGTVFQITPEGKLTMLHSFCSQKKCADGADPYAGVIEASDGNFYGTTSKGGAGNWGTIFAITPAGKLTTLHSFCSQKNCTDGADPVGGLLQASDGNFYGTTTEGGTYENGTVFRLSMGSSSQVETLSASAEAMPSPQLREHWQSFTGIPFHRQRVVVDPSARAFGPIKTAGFNCSPAPCVLPSTQASEGGSIVTDPVIVTNPANAKQLLLGSFDGNCPGASALGFHLSRDGGSSWQRVICMPYILTKDRTYWPTFEPSVGYDRNGTAYIAGEYSDSEGMGYGFLAVQKSTDGTHWSKPVVALHNAARYSPVETWLTVDTSPGSPRVNSLYVSGVLSPGPSSGKSQVLVSHSTDGGATWKQAAVDTVQKYPAMDEFTRMSVGKDGTVYLTWMQCPASGPDESCSDGTGYVMFSKSTDGGSTWSPPRLIAMATSRGLLANTSIGVDNYPLIAVDKSDGPDAGNLYVATYTWTGTHMQVQVIRSTDGGNRWSQPLPPASKTDTHDQFFPAISVSPTGLVGVSWLDRRNDPADHNYQAFAAISNDGGKSFQPNWQLTKKFSNPDNNGTGNNWMGDYTGNTWVGQEFIAAWMDSSNGVDMQEVIGGVRLK